MENDENTKNNKKNNELWTIAQQKKKLTWKDRFLPKL